MSGFVTAVRTLTVLPCPGKDAKDFSASLPWFPVVGLVLGSILYGIVLAYGGTVGGAWPEGLAVVLLVVGVVLTRGLHLDGLADWADGFWGASERTHVLAIMKDSSVGTFGTLSLVLVSLAKWVGFVQLATEGGGLWIVAACIVSRTVQVDLAVSLPYAREEGGTGEAFVQGARPAHLAAAVLCAAVVLLVLCGGEGLVALACGWVAGRLFGAWCRMRVAGVTGDLLGAASELVETGILMMGAVVTHVHV